MKISDLEELSLGRVIQCSKDLEINELVIDTRSVTLGVGVAFFAIVGKNHDGHTFAKEAYESGIRIFFVQKGVKLPQDACIYWVKDTVEALQKIARKVKKQ